MSITLKDGGPAFPLKEPTTHDDQGMSLRQYYAAHAPEMPDWFRVARVEHRNARMSDLYFAWRWHYADMMIATERGQE